LDKIQNGKSVKVRVHRIVTDEALETPDLDIKEKIEG
jgi:hypothetical protein